MVSLCAYFQTRSHSEVPGGHALGRGGRYSICDCIQLQTLNTEIAVAAIGLLLSLLLENRERTKSEFASNHVVNFWLEIKMRLIVINVF